MANKLFDGASFGPQQLLLRRIMAGAALLVEKRRGFPYWREGGSRGVERLVTNDTSPLAIVAVLFFLSSSSEKEGVNQKQELEAHSSLHLTHQRLCKRLLPAPLRTPHHEVCPLLRCFLGTCFFRSELQFLAACFSFCGGGEGCGTTFSIP